MCPLEHWKDGKGYTLGEGLVDCSLLGLVNLLGHVVHLGVGVALCFPVTK